MFYLKYYYRDILNPHYIFFNAKDSRSQLSLFPSLFLGGRKGFFDFEYWTLDLYWDSDLVLVPSKQNKKPKRLLGSEPLTIYYQGWTNARRHQYVHYEHAQQKLCNNGSAPIEQLKTKEKRKKKQKKQQNARVRVPIEEHPLSQRVPLLLSRVAGRDRDAIGLLVAVRRVC